MAVWWFLEDVSFGAGAYFTNSPELIKKFNVRYSKLLGVSIEKDGFDCSLLKNVKSDPGQNLFDNPGKVLLFLGSEAGNNLLCHTDVKIMMFSEHLFPLGG